MGLTFWGIIPRSSTSSDKVTGLMLASFAITRLSFVSKLAGWCLAYGEGKPDPNLNKSSSEFLLLFSAFRGDSRHCENVIFQRSAYIWSFDFRIKTWRSSFSFSFLFKWNLKKKDLFNQLVIWIVTTETYHLNQKLNHKIDYSLKKKYALDNTDFFYFFLLWLGCKGHMRFTHTHTWSVSIDQRWSSICYTTLTVKRRCEEKLKRAWSKTSKPIPVANKRISRSKR